jgi:hypothetical protein
MTLFRVLRGNIIIIGLPLPEPAAPQNLGIQNVSREISGSALPMLEVLCFPEHEIQLNVALNDVVNCNAHGEVHSTSILKLHPFH